MQEIKKRHTSFKDRTGEKHTTNEGYHIEIILYNNKKDCTIKFENGLVLSNRVYRDVKNGNISNPYHKSVSGVGYIGHGKYSTLDMWKKSAKSRKSWKNMINRCYSKTQLNSKPTYKKVTVCEEWRCFQNYAEWYEENYKEDFDVDKDILIKGNKSYSPETCCFVPDEINTLFVKNDSVRGECPVGVSKHMNKFRVKFNVNNINTHFGLFDTKEEAFECYKFNKEKEIKRVADKW